MSLDYYGKVGCCLTCDSGQKELEVIGWNGIDGEGCLCFSCKCNKCSELEIHQCQHTNDYLSWDDYVKIAEKVQVEGRKQFGPDPKNLIGVFSNGTIVKHVSYANVMDVPTQVKYFLEGGYPYHSRTLLLEKIFLKKEKGV
jgi:hypothetical protein